MLNQAEVVLTLGGKKILPGLQGIREALSTSYFANTLLATLHKIIDMTGIQTANISRSSLTVHIFVIKDLRRFLVFITLSICMDRFSTKA